MGSCVSRRKQPPISFDPLEFQMINQTMETYYARSSITRKYKQLTEESMQDIFKENQKFGTKIYNFFKVYSKSDYFIPQDAICEICNKYGLLLKVQIFIKKNYQIRLNHFEPIELFSLISLEEYSFLEYSDLQSLNVTYLQVFELLMDICKIQSNYQFFDERPVKAFIDELFDKENTTVQWPFLVQHLKKQLGGANKVIRAYFKQKFMDPNVKINIPSLTHPSYILNEGWLFLLSMSANSCKLQKSHKLTLIYSSLIHPGGFSTLVSNTQSQQLPTLTLIQHQEDPVCDGDEQIRCHIFGAISNERWYDTGLACGTQNDCIFSLHPKFHVYAAQNNRQGKKNFQYMNLEGNPNKPIGLGFGGSSAGQDCRIWLDQTFGEKCYSKNSDLCYEDGPLLQFNQQEMNITLVEVWGIQRPEDYQQQMIPSHQADRSDPLIVSHYEKSISKSVSRDFYWHKEEQKLDGDQFDLNSYCGSEGNQEVKRMTIPQLQDTNISNFLQRSSVPLQSVPLQSQPKHRGKITTKDRELINKYSEDNAIQQD